MLALGSWRTYEHLNREEGVEIMRAAREHGLDFLDDARYDDETGEAPIPTGHSEMVFGELFRAAGWKRDEVVVANKLWWEFWPKQSAAEEVDASLGRMGFDYLDLVYAWATKDGPAVEEVVSSVGGLIASGKVRAWGTGNWEPEDHAQAARRAAEMGVPPPCAAQLPYNLIVREYVEGPAIAEALDVSGASVVASYVLYGGALSGKYSGGSAPGRLAGTLDAPELQPVLQGAKALRALAAQLNETAASLAIAFVLANGRVASALFGATSAAQVEENVRAVDLLQRLTPTELDELQAVCR
jgi:aryl-alcohol dehydrogenase-like predicted oxidoreductase